MRKQLGFAFVVAVGLVGCGGGTTVTGDAAKGKTLYNQATLGTTTKATGCVSCHSIQPGVKVNGPSLAGFGTEAEAEFKAHERASAQDFVKFAITNPDAELATGYEKGIMPANYGTVLTAAELDDLSAYILTLK